MKAQIEQLAERPDLLSVVAEWIYNEWWTEVEGASVNSLADLLRPNLVRDQIPLTLIASFERCPVGTATLLAHDVETEEWPELSPWLAAVYVAPEYRCRGVGAALIQAVVEKARPLGALRVKSKRLIRFEANASILNSCIANHLVIAYLHV